MTSFNTDLGARIKNYRIMQGMSQQKLAACLGVTFQQIQKYERGLNRISAEYLVRLADTLNVAPQALLTGEQAATPLRRLDLGMYAEMAECSDEQKIALVYMIKAFRNRLTEKESIEATKENL